MPDCQQLEVSRTIAAAPAEVFAVLADPARHSEIDGSGMLRGLAAGHGPVTGIGDEFVMDMRQDPLGDYRMCNEIIDFEPNRRIVWAPSFDPRGTRPAALGNLDLSGYTWGWELEPTAAGGTRVTHTYDWSGVRDRRAPRVFPRVTVGQMAETITRLEAATGRLATVPRTGSRRTG